MWAPAGCLGSQNLNAASCHGFLDSICPLSALFASPHGHFAKKMNPGRLPIWPFVMWSFAASWAIALARGATACQTCPGRTWVFLVLSDTATGVVAVLLPDPSEAGPVKAR
jgi:hypothetical protein